MALAPLRAGSQTPRLDFLGTRMLAEATLLALKQAYWKRRERHRPDFFDLSGS